MEFYSLNLNEREIFDEVKEVFFDSSYLFKEFSLDDLEQYYFEDLDN